MVCDKCEKKLGSLVVADKWKAGATSRAPQSAGPSSSSSMSKLAEKRAARLAEAGGGMARQCRICKVRVGDGRYYCNGCAYKKAICAMCGTKIGDTKLYKRSSKRGRPACLGLWV